MSGGKGSNPVAENANWMTILQVRLDKAKVGDTVHVSTQEQKAWAIAQRVTKEHDLFIQLD